MSIPLDTMPFRMKALSKIWLAVALVLCSVSLRAQDGAASAQPPAAAQKILGSVVAIDNDIVTISSPTGAAKVQVQDSTQIVRAEPGQKDLKQATPITLKDLQMGDRVLARVLSAAGSAPAVAASLIVMK